MVTSHPVNAGNIGAANDKALTIVVNGVPEYVHNTVRFITYDRAVRLSRLKWRKDYDVSVSYADMPDSRLHLNHGTMVSIEQGMTVFIEVPAARPKRWWEFWK